MLFCTGCYLTWYCSPACQKKDWKEHQVQLGYRVPYGTVPYQMVYHICIAANIECLSRALGSLVKPVGSANYAFCPHTKNNIEQLESAVHWYFYVLVVTTCSKFVVLSLFIVFWSFWDVSNIIIEENAPRILKEIRENMKALVFLNGFSNFKYING